MQNNINELLSLLKKLTNETKPLWGKMSAQHMVEHLILAAKMSNGKLKYECFNPPEKLPVLKKFLTSSRPLPRNFINPAIGEDLIPLEFDSLEIAKEALIHEMTDHFNYFIKYPDAVLTNVTFGDLSKNEWEVFHIKHITHHLNQFGLIE